MLERDKSHFEEVWQNKEDQGQVVGAYYGTGQNLRVDKACAVAKGGERLLDIGCGSGLLGARMKEKYQYLCGVDIVESAVEMARKMGMDAQVVNLNAAPLPYEQNTFDTITILATLQYIYDPYFLLRECQRVLKPGGNLLISIPNMRTFWRLFNLSVKGVFPRTSLDPVGLDGGTIHYFCFQNLVEIVDACGFRVSATYGLYCLPKLSQRLPDHGILGSLKREFFSAEILVDAFKVD